MIPEINKSRVDPIAGPIGVRVSLLPGAGSDGGTGDRSAEGIDTHRCVRSYGDRRPRGRQTNLQVGQPLRVCDSVPDAGRRMVQHTLLLF